MYKETASISTVRNKYAEELKFKYRLLLESVKAYCLCMFQWQMLWFGVHIRRFVGKVPEYLTLVEVKARAQMNELH